MHLGCNRSVVKLRISRPNMLDYCVVRGRIALEGFEPALIANGYGEISCR